MPLAPHLSLDPRISIVGKDGTERGWFPVGRIICVGRNYADHAREMGSDPEREPPFFFMKPASCLNTGESVRYPSRTAELHHEVELVIAVGAGGRNLSPRDAMLGVVGCAVGLDLTRRDLQAAMKASGRPWEAGKVFPGAAPCGALVQVGDGIPDARARIRLWRDGDEVQSGCIGDMIWSVPEILAEVSELFELLPGDLIFTGTPSGVGPLQVGQRLLARVDGLPELHCLIESE